MCHARSVVSASATKQIRRLLSNYPTLLEGLDAFIAEEVKTFASTELAEPPLESQTNTKQQFPGADGVTPAAPEMMEKKSTLFGNPFIHPLESPLQAVFLSDNNIPDGHIFPAGAEFVKSWHLKNDGTEDWMLGTRLVFVGGMRLGVRDSVPTTSDIGYVPAGQEIDVNAGTMKAPDTPGRYISHWRLRDPQGRHFGPRVGSNFFSGFSDILIFFAFLFCKMWCE
jgi:Ig-like domain from next to BRCA1 gene